MPERLSLRVLDSLPSHIERPRFEPRTLGIGIVHIGLGNFHRAHQAVFTEDAIAAAGGDWGIVGVSLMRPDVSRALTPQDNLYSLEVLGGERRYRVMGVLRGSLAAIDGSAPILDAIAAPQTHVVTLTVTEKGYCLDGTGAVDFEHPDIRHDLARPDAPRSALGWLAAGLTARRRTSGAPLTVISCDNLSDNGSKLGRALQAFAGASNKDLADWIDGNVAFPRTMVDCIVPATDALLRTRVADVLGVHDTTPIMRETFAQWVIENRFAGPRPAWESGGAEIVADVAPFERLKLHVLNASHSALAYMGLLRGHEFVREAIENPELSRFASELVAEEIAPALFPLAVAAYWKSVRRRFANRLLDHRLAQIAEDGSVKLAQRIFPVLVANVRAGRPHARLVTVVRAWLDFARRGPVKDPASDHLSRWAASGARLEDALDNPALFPGEFRSDPPIRHSILGFPS